MNQQENKKASVYYEYRIAMTGNINITAQPFILPFTSEALNWRGLDPILSAPDPARQLRCI